MDDIEIIVTARTNKVGSKDETVVSFDREDWEAMSETERLRRLADKVDDFRVKRFA